MPDNDFKLRLAIYWIAQEFGSRAKSDRLKETDPDARAALERKWMLIFASRKVFEHYFPDGAWKSQLQKAHAGDWELGVGARGQWFLRAYADAKAGVVTAYKNSKKIDPHFVHRNWMRGKRTPEEVSEILKDIVLSTREPIGPIR